MEESLARMTEGLPTEAHEILYKTWAEDSQFGLLITGNVQVDPLFLCTPFDVCVPSSPDTATPQDTDRLSHAAERWAAWKRACGSTPCLVQLNHPGRQSPRGVTRAPWRPALAPSNVPMSSSTSLAGKVLEKVAFGPVKEATKEQLHTIVKQFVQGAIVAHRAGFAGVQIHARCVCFLCFSEANAFDGPVVDRRSVL